LTPRLCEDLERQVGSDFSRILDELDQVDPNSAEGQKYTADQTSIESNGKEFLFSFPRVFRRHAAFPAVFGSHRLV
jgi:hypothetical protein